SEEGGRGLALLATVGAGDIAGSKGGFLKRMGGQIKQTIERGRSEEGAKAAKTLEDFKKAGLTSDQIRMRPGGQELLDLAESHRLAEPLIQELQNTAGLYSTAAPDTKAQAMQILNDIGVPLSPT